MLTPLETRFLATVSTPELALEMRRRLRNEVPQAATIIENLAKELGVKVEAITSRSDKNAAYIAASRLRDAGLTIEAVGVALNYKDHSGAHAAIIKGDEIVMNTTT